MVNDIPTAEPVPGVRSVSPFRTVANVQGLYFLVTGLWPLLHVDSFQAVTGPKADLWLVYTVGALVSAIGVALLVAAGNGRISVETATLAIGSALVLAAIDVIFVARDVISWVYLLDAAAEVVLVGWWVLAYQGLRNRPPAPAPQYPYLQALLARGQSVTPNGRT
jgi:hypothetical protein